MKRIQSTLLRLFLVLIITGVGLRADNGPGWYGPASTESEIVVSPGMSGSGLTKPPKNMEAGFSLTTPASADEVTAEIQALARGLLNDPVRIFAYVRNQIEYEHYYGSKKGALLTLLERSGNDFDQSALLVALLRAAGYTAQYQSGWVLMPYSAVDHKDAVNWWGLATAAYPGRTLQSMGYSTNNFPGAVSEQAIKNFILASRTCTQNGWPTLLANAGFQEFFVQRVWVLASISGDLYWLDPAFKTYQSLSQTNFTNWMNYSRTAFLSQAGGTTTSNSVEQLSYLNVSNDLVRFTTNFLANLPSNAPNASPEQIVGGRILEIADISDLAGQMPFSVATNFGFGSFPVQSWNTIPTNYATALRLQLGGGVTNLWMTQLQGKRLSVSFSNSLGQVWLDDTLLLSEPGPASGSNVALAVAIDHPHVFWLWTNSAFVVQDKKRNDQSETNNYRRTAVTGVPYSALIYSFRASPDSLRQRERKLDDYLRRGYSTSSREVVTETLNTIGLNWLLQTEMSDCLLGAQRNVVVLNHHRFGRVTQENGYYVDVGQQQVGSYDRAADDSLTFDQNFEVANYFASAMEHGVIEQKQGGTNTGVSTIRILHLANANGDRIFKVNSTNFNAVSSQWTGYSSSEITKLQQAVNAGATLLLPRNGQLTVNVWSGSGRVEQRTNSMAMLISGGLNGGYNTRYNYVNPTLEFYANAQQADYFDPTHSGVMPTRGADPVNMADGSFTYNHADLSVGQAEPRGLSFERSYTSSRRNHNLAQLGFGWTHNYAFALAETSDVRAGLGWATPYEMAAYLVATSVAFDVYANSNSVKHWALTALVANWAVDQLKRNSVSISLGAQTVQFTHQPDGTFTAPAGVTMTLVRTNNAYELRQRQGSVFRFNATNQLAEIEDVHGKKMSFTYLSDGRIQQARDAYNRTLTFSYGSASQLDSVTDSTGRSVQFGFDSALNLTSVTDPEGKMSTFTCDTNHQITFVRDADNRGVVENFYDDFGRVVQQHSEGSSNKFWRLYYSGSCNLEEDSFSGRRSFFYDRRGRPTGLQDAQGNRSRLDYDGQDHVVQSVTPMNEATTFTFDAAHNLLRTRDPMGFSVTNYYDSQHHRTRVVDGRGFTNYAVYNARHQVIEQRNPLGQSTFFSYDPTHGTLSSTDDAASNTVTYAYDAYDETARVNYPDGEYETSARNTRGDVLVQRNARGFFNTNSYNLRRQLTDATGPSNVVTRIVYDNSGNVIAMIDARSFASSNAWSGTGKLLTQTLPPTGAGRAVLTNIYDTRDQLDLAYDALGQATDYIYYLNGWLGLVTDPLQRSHSFQYDADGRKLRDVAPLNRTWLFGYNARGEQTSWTWPSSASIRYGYDANGSRTALTNRLSRRTLLAYDAANRLMTNTTHLGRITSRTYDPRGLVRTVREPSGRVTTNFYDSRARLTNRVDEAGSIAYNYDAGNLPLTVKEGSKTITRTYDGLGRLETYTDGASNQLRYSYDASGNLTRLQYPDGKAVSYGYDGRNQMTNVTDWAGRKTGLSYDLNGRVTQVVRPNGTKRGLTYDAAGQTTRIEERDGQNHLIALFRYGYDAAGEITNRFMVPRPQPVALAAQTAAYDADNRLATLNSVTVTHDVDGNLTSGPVTNATANSYGWDARHRLTSVGGLGYNYDAEGHRIATTNGGSVTKFVINPAPALSQVLVRTKADGSQTFYVYGLGLLYEAATNGTTRTYHYDYLGSTVAITDDSGQVTDRVEYSPYASVVYRTGSTDTPFLFNGRYGVMSEANGLLQMRSRYYSAYLGRFVSEDAAGFAGGMNFYAYANGNPVSYLDPFGFGAVEPGVMSRIGTWLWNQSILGPPPPEMVVYPGSASGMYTDASGMPVPQSSDYVRVDSRGDVVDQRIGIMPGWLVGPAAQTAVNITFQTGHVTQHLQDLGLAAQQVEAAIAAEVRAATQGASQTGSFWGRVTVGEKVVEYRAYTLPNGTINVGTYYPHIP